MALSQRTLWVCARSAGIPRPLCADCAATALQATAKVSSSCTSRTSGGGKAEGCAYSEAAAYAYEVAYASAHASASAEAFAKYCTCNDAEAWAFGESSFFLTMVADVFAEATSAACASGMPPNPPRIRPESPVCPPCRALRFE